MLWGCNITKYHPCKVQCEDECVLTIQNIFLKTKETHKKGPIEKIYIHLKHNENDILICILKTIIKDSLVVNIPINMNKESKVEFYLKGGNIYDDISIDLVGNITKVHNKYKYHKQNK